ncbi:plexin-C1 [Rhineura floridana]|uniref:plexin-C1 n=1 Tax=Rhineura floridana TaxID=261503 RepID=UPI002AC818DA|nr:plexin-C1 [Rhineura floridana]
MAGWPRRAKERLGGGFAWCLALPAVVMALAAEEPARFLEPIDNLAVSWRRLFVASGNQWYEVEPSLAWMRRHQMQEDSSVNKLLLPFGDNLLLTCWTKPEGSCYKQDLSNEQQQPAIFGQELVTCLRRGSASGWMYYNNHSSEWHLVVATTQKLNDSQADKCTPAKSTAETAVTIKGEHQKSVSDYHLLPLAGNNFLYFVDAFLWNKHFFFPYYHYNLSVEPKVVILKQDLVRNHVLRHGQKILGCAGGTRILSSKYIEERALWIGVFDSAETQRTPTSTALCIFDLSQVLNNSEGCNFNGFAEFPSDPSSDEPSACDRIAWPINNSTLLSHSDLVSVYATVVLNKIVLFLGTGKGQLLKVILDENMKPNCPDILFEIEEETTIFHKLELDPTDKDYIYLPSNNEIRRTRVANCGKYISCKECLSAMDPHCGWCYLNNSCTLKGECPFSNNLTNWASISYGSDKCLKIYTSKTDRGEISVTAVGNSEAQSTCKVIDVKTNKTLCENEKPAIMNCSCHLKRADLIGKVVQVLLISGSWHLSEIFEFDDCSLEKICSECSSHTGCTSSARENRCVSWTVTCTQKVDCHGIVNASSGKDTSQSPEPMLITSIEPMWISTLGKNEVLVRGENFTRSGLYKMLITGTSSCKPDEIPVTEVLNRTHMKFCLPPSRKEAKSICIKKNGFQCSPPVPLYYVTLPVCSGIFPNVSWKSGGRNMTIRGRHLNVTDMVTILDEWEQNLTQFTCHRARAECGFTTPTVSPEKKTASVVLKVEKRNISCIEFRYDPDPEFIHYELTTDLEPDLELKIHKENDNLSILRSEIEVFMSHMIDNKLLNITFTVQNISQTATRSIIHCRAKRSQNSSASKIDTSSVKVYVKVGNFKCEVPNEARNYSFLYILLLIPVVIVVAVFVTQRKSKQLNRKLSEHLELLECELRKEIRDGFVELQMEKLDVVDSFETIPFLDYKHFVLRTFFPEAGGTSFIFIEDSNEPVSRNPGHKDESITALYALICNKHFLVTLIHTLEKQKTFSVKDRCLFASFLTIALQTNLVYLTHILEVLTRDLMEQSSNIQPKLMLRRTESVVEKLLTNWMSVCLSGFLRETFGEPFYLLVTTLNQRIIRGPVDVITCKALYTLNEDWLLWQVTEFNVVALNVVFEKIPENEGEGTSQTIQVNVLDCDTIGQAKEKILQAFLDKNGSLYGLQLSEMGLALQSGAQATELLDIDSSSVILENGITKLNTIQHYEISDGATIKVFKKTTNLSDGEYSHNYCHLILPDSEAAKDTQGSKHKGKQKFKVKEMYLTKLLSTKVAIHCVVEKLFRSIWTLPNNKAPVAIKYFFDFLDAQAENKKITDPDVVHIWKTNSLPLRFWVNILKNPQFVFDIKKTPHLDGCLSVIAQAFMDAFSLSEQQLGKEAPTNKLLYAKDIPLYKEEVKAFYKAVRDLPSVSTSELEEFLTQESKKHENEFNKAAALTKIYHYIARYFDEILNKLEKERGLEEARKQLLCIRALVEEKKKCKWISEESTVP